MASHPPIPEYARRALWRRRAKQLMALLFAGGVLVRLVMGLVD